MDKKQKQSKGKASKEIELKVKEVNPPNVVSSASVILESEQGDRIAIGIGIYEATNIAYVLYNEPTKRPMTYDFFKSILALSDFKIEKMVIHDIRDTTFYANLHVSLNGKTHIIDSRPSDSINMVMRTEGAKIFATEEVLEKERKDREEQEKRLKAYISQMKEKIENLEQKWVDMPPSEEDPDPDKDPTTH